MPIICNFFQKFRNLWLEYYPEMLGVLSATLLALAITASSLVITLEHLGSISSLLCQILAAYLGLLLATFGVLYGLDLKAEYLARAKQNGLSDDQIIQIKLTMKSIYSGFVYAIATLATGTFYSFSVYCLSVVSKDQSYFVYPCTHIIKSVLLGFMFGFFVTGTMNIISTVKTILELTDLS